MSSVHHLDADHPFKGRLAHVSALLTPSESAEHSDQSRRSNNGATSMSHAVPPPRLFGQKRKRLPRAARACEFCREKKYKCDEQITCSRCKKRNRPCIYKDADLARGRFQPVAHSLPKDTSYDYSNFNLDNRHEAHGADHMSQGDEENEEVSEVNPHTTEFHGPTSSLAFLAAVQHQPQKHFAQVDGAPRSLVSVFHNESFSPQATRSQTTDDQSFSLTSTRYHFRQSRCFLDGYFQNLHFIHPVIDRTDFYSRCEDLWFGRSESQPAGFVALYFALMSIGALVQEWDEEAIDGMGRFEWARKMFHLASDALEMTLAHSDLFTIQACLIMAKVCQNELNPHLAYLYLGRAVRTALSAGFNRRSRRMSSIAQSEKHSYIAKTWWGLYSLEIEMGFALGRPDSLGLDIYHNQILPPVDDTEYAILTTMVDFARIVRQVSISIYMSTQSLPNRLTTASEIEHTMDAWVDSVPKTIRPDFSSTQTSTMTKEPKWAKKQKHTLKFRYFNVKMVLYRPFLLLAAVKYNSADSALQGPVEKCVSAAKATILLMHQLYCDMPYFRTWWYNVTYTLYAASIILCYMSRLAKREERADLQRYIDMSIDVLDAMREHVVATKAKVVLQQALQQAQAQERPNTTLPQRMPQPVETPLMQLANVSADASGQHSADDPFLDPFQDVHLDFLGQLFPFDDTYISPWPS